MSKPTADEWCAWATANKVARPIRAWVTMNPKAMNSYLDPNQEDNEYIFKPSKSGQFASPRSLAKASIIVEQRDVIGENALAVALAGTIGESAAKSMAAFIALEDRLVLTKDILKDAGRVAVPDDVSALIMMMFEAVDYLDNQDDLNNYMAFVNRIKQSEIQSIFFTMMMRTKPRIARYNAAITKWATENHMLM